MCQIKSFVVKGRKHQEMNPGELVAKLVPFTSSAAADGVTVLTHWCLGSL